MKTCLKCNETKELHSFYKHPDMKDGYLNFCKDCKKEYAINYRNENISIVRQKDKKRHSPEMLTVERKRNRATITKNWRREDKNRSKCHNFVKRHMSHLKPDECSICEKKNKIIAHHEDYDKPGEVVWCCQACHKTVMHGDV